MLWDDQLPVREVQYIRECLSHPHVGRHPSLEGDRFHKGLSFGDIALEVSRKSVAETGNDVVIGCGDLLEVNHVRFGEDTAPPCNAGRIGRFQGEFAKGLDR